MGANLPGSLQDSSAPSAPASFPWFNGQQGVPDPRWRPMAVEPEQVEPVPVEPEPVEPVQSLPVQPVPDAQTVSRTAAGWGSEFEAAIRPAAEPVVASTASVAQPVAQPVQVPTEPVPDQAAESEQPSVIAALRAGVTESRFRAAVLVVLCLLAVFVLRNGSGAIPGTGTNENWNQVSAAMVTTLTASEGVAGASGGYLPGVGLVFYAELTKLARDSMDAWLLAMMSPMSSRFADLPDTEAVVWHLAVVGDGAYTQLVRVPGDAVTAPAKWSEPANASVAGPVATGASTAQPSVAATASAAATGSAAATTPAAATGTAPAASASASAPAAAGSGSPVSDDFSAGADKWTTLTGAWQVADGVYHQSDASGYDLISQLTAAVPATYDVQVKMRAVGDKLGAGLLIGQPKAGTRNGATLIDVTDGSYMRWGNYGAGGTYTFVGGNGLPGVATKGQWHVLKLSVRADKTVIFWDEKNIGEIKAVPKGGVALVTSVSAVDFDDFSVKAP